MFSVSRPYVARVAEYIRDQQQRHARDRLWTEWEEMDEETPALTPDAELPPGPE